MMDWTAEDLAFRYTWQSARSQELSMSRLFAALALFAAFAFLPSGANAESLSLIGDSTKICQLTGQIDWVTNKPTAAKTLSNFGLIAVDLGYPVDSGAGGLYFLFGDAWPIAHIPLDPLPPDDALGFTTRTTTPDDKTCLDLQLVTSAAPKFGHPTVTPKMEQGSFNVPTGGVFLDGTLYAFFWTTHCVLPNPVMPNVAAPLTLPPPSPHCTEVPSVGTSLGSNRFAQASPSAPLAFTQTPPPDPFIGPNPLARMPSGFIYVSASERNVEFAPHQNGVAVFGVPRYRASVPYLAMAPRATFGDPSTWSFYAGSDASGNSQWVTRQQWESGNNGSGQWVPPPGAQIYYPVPKNEYCIGEHSVTWNEPLHKWLLVYNCGPWNIEARVAPHPWGPWSGPTSILNLAQPVLCTLIMSIHGCGTQANYWPPPPPPPLPPGPNAKVMPGIFYAPFVMNRFTEDSTLPGGDRRATIYWLVSTWNPYQAVVMRSTLRLAP
jgi:hypothetical protein